MARSEDSEEYQAESASRCFQEYRPQIICHIDQVSVH